MRNPRRSSAKAIGTLSREQMREKIESLRSAVGHDVATTEVKRWWRAFEEAHLAHPSVVLRTLEELRTRKASLSQFHRACRAAQTENIRAALHYLDFMQLREKEERKSRDV